MNIENKQSPMVRINDLIDYEGVEYLIKVNDPSLYAFLDEIKLTKEQLPNGLFIIIQENSPHEGASSIFRKQSYAQINLYGDDTWEMYTENIKQVGQLLSGAINPEEADFSDLLYTQRLGEYLANVPKDRGEKFARKILLQAASREISGDFLHEIKHILDQLEGKYYFWFQLSFVFDQIGLLDKIDPTEQSADMFEETYRKHPLWRQLILLSQKQ